ncbi:sulfite oxidase heme-binding subunit YedZ [Leucothrix pacifica]|uniref:Iron reductase n=1 Tax=Leucothrix pacifica TaxID=1247513 RepID=A0A317CD01_9GAMM|nr:ferric reductase-like transmembrane domain-containing protein [Leucothrix pacifica]PWQ96555.1 iron reductase [Leucothrix pacifica]
MSFIKSVLGSRYFLWAILALPSFGFAMGLANETMSVHQLLHPTGEFSARFMIIAMAATPLRLMFNGKKWTMWLVRNRRYFGVAAFFYALFHTILYVIDSGTVQVMLDEALKLGIWTGWLAFFIFIPLAVTSNDASVKAMRQKWKPLQRWVYPAAVLTLLHWIFVENNVGPAMVHIVILGGLEAYRVWHQQFRKTKPVTT